MRFKTFRLHYSVKAHRRLHARDSCGIEAVAGTRDRYDAYPISAAISSFERAPSPQEIQVRHSFCPVVEAEPRRQARMHVAPANDVAAEFDCFFNLCVFSMPSSLSETTQESPTDPPGCDLAMRGFLGREC